MTEPSPTSMMNGLSSLIEGQLLSFAKTNGLEPVVLVAAANAAVLNIAGRDLGPDFVVMMCRRMAEEFETGRPRLVFTEPQGRG